MLQSNLPGFVCFVAPTSLVGPFWRIDLADILLKIVEPDFKGWFWLKPTP
jgi:hypothetical protein